MSTILPDLVVLAIRNIRHRKRRSWLTVLGIFIGIAAVVSLVSLGQGLSDSVTTEFQELGADKLFITSGALLGGGEPLTDAEMDVVRSVRGVEAVGGAYQDRAIVEFNGQRQRLRVIGIPEGRARDIILEDLNIELSQGRMVRSVDRSSIIIGSMVATDTFEKDPGLRSKLALNGTDYRVVGVMAQGSGQGAADQAIVMPLREARDVFGVEDRLSRIGAVVSPSANISVVKEDVEAALREYRDVEEGEEDFVVLTAEDIVSSFNSILGVVNAVVAGIAAISLLVGGIGIMNTMYTAVSERTREIGVMKAVGAQRRDIMLVFLLESGLIGLVGGVLGVLVGLGLASVAVSVARSFVSIPLSISMSPVLIGGALAFSFITGMLSGVMPARNAANLQPVDALRSE